MDEAYTPDERKWISPLTNIGQAMEDLKRLVRLKRESLLVNSDQEEPPPRLLYEVTYPESPDSEKGEERTCNSEGEGQSQEESNLHDDDEDVNQPYMSTAASKVVRTDLETESEFQTESFKRKVENTNRSKWSTSDEVCEAAIASMRYPFGKHTLVGKEFFELDDKKLEKKFMRMEKEQARLKKGLGRGRGRGRKSTRGRPSSKRLRDEDDEESDSDIEDSMSEVENSQIGGNTSANMSCEDETESDQAVSGGREEPERILPDEDDILGADFFDKLMGSPIPEALNYSGNTTRLLIDHDSNIVDNDDNYTNWAGKRDAYRKKYREIMDSDCDSSEDSDHVAGKFSDEEDQESSHVEDEVNRRRTPCSDLVEYSRPEPQPGPSRKPTTSKSRRRGSSPINISNIKEEVASDDESIASSRLAPTPTENQDSERGREEGGQSVVEDFKRFTDWVFQQSKKRDSEERVKMRPELMSKLGLNEKETRNLQRFTSASLAKVKSEVFQDEPLTKTNQMPMLAPPIDVSDRNTLQSLAIFITHGDDPSAFPWKSVIVQQQMNDDFAYAHFLKRMEQQKLDVVNPAMKDQLVDKEEDFLVQVLVYQATNPEDILPEDVKTHIDPKLAYELHVLGSQTVAELIEKIHCENDMAYLTDVPHPDQFVADPTQYAKHKFPGKMLLIHESIFTNPSVTDVDYVKLINDWAASTPAKHVGPFKRGDWKKKLKDIDLRFGMPYVYIHLGGCEHIIVFTKARLLHLEDEHVKRFYPKISGTPRFKNIYCRVDNDYLARWSVVGYKELPEDPMLLCTECVLLYCYDKKKKKRGEFKLYPFAQLANCL